MQHLKYDSIEPKYFVLHLKFLFLQPKKIGRQIYVMNIEIYSLILQHQYMLHNFCEDYNYPQKIVQYPSVHSISVI